MAAQISSNPVNAKPEKQADPGKVQLVEKQPEKPVEKQPEKPKGPAPEILQMKETVLVVMEYQNEFLTKDGEKVGGLYYPLKAVVESTGMIDKTVDLVRIAREAGIHIIHVRNEFEPGYPNCANPHYGIFGGCKEKKIFLKNEWGWEFIPKMQPQEGDTVIGKTGLCSFYKTTLQEELQKRNIKNIALTGMMTDCCVGSTMRAAYERGYNVFTIGDCTACMSMEMWNAAVHGTFNFFSKPHTKDEFVKQIYRSLMPGNQIDEVDLMPSVMEGDIALHELDELEKELYATPVSDKAGEPGKKVAEVGVIPTRSGCCLFGMGSRNAYE